MRTIDAKQQTFESGLVAGRRYVVWHNRIGTFEAEVLGDPVCQSLRGTHVTLRITRGVVYSHGAQEWRPGDVMSVRKQFCTFEEVGGR